MSIKITPRTINPALAEKIREISGEDIGTCMQCGTCGGVCPMYEEVACAPRTMVMLAQLGLEEELQAKPTYEYCAACHSCQVRCPRGLDLPKVMEALRLLKLRMNEDLVNPNEIPVEDLEEAPQIAFVSGFRKMTS